ncbi:MAG: type II secretion system F family protein [Pseudolabrys sp.]
MSAFTQEHLIYILVGVSAALLAEGVYLLFFNRASYRKNVNRRLQLMGSSGGQEEVLVQLRRERGLTGEGDYRLPLVSLNKLVLQSGLTFSFLRMAVVIFFSGAMAFAGGVIGGLPLARAATIAVPAAFILPYLILLFMRMRRQRRFAAQFPDAIDIIVRSLRAGHPTPIAITMVAKELPDPVGSEFGMIADEITYGADLETAIRNLYYRVGTDDLPLFVTAVAIQTSTGGNLGEILENLSGVIRQRFKMRRKIRALAAEGRAAAMILSSLPIGMFAVIQFVTPDFYASVWPYAITKMALAAAGAWMGVGNFIMYRMVNFRI